MDNRGQGTVDIILAAVVVAAVVLLGVLIYGGPNNAAWFGTTYQGGVNPKDLWFTKGKNAGRHRWPKR